MLHHQDEQILMLDPNNTKSIFCMDLNRGSVVDEWTPDGISNVFNISASTKFGSQTPESTFVALNGRAIFTMDPRVKGNKAVR
jgi:hypothetical protein